MVKSCSLTSWKGSRDGKQCRAEGERQKEQEHERWTQEIISATWRFAEGGIYMH
jgi:hypothetical protein